MHTTSHTEPRTQGAQVGQAGGTCGDPPIGADKIPEIKL